MNRVVIAVAAGLISLIAAGAEASSIVLVDRAPACGWGPDFCSPPYPYTNGLPTAIPDGAPSAFSTPYFSSFTLSSDSSIDTVTWLAMTAASTVTFYDDGGTAFTSSPPGSTLGTYVVDSSNSVGTLVGYAWPDTSDEVYLFTLSLSAPLSLAGGQQYWISIDSGGWARNGGSFGYCTTCGLAGQAGMFGSANFMLSGAVPEPALDLLLTMGILVPLARRHSVFAS